MVYNKNCGRCALGSFCGIRGQLNLDYCSLFTKELEYCDECGSPIIKNKKSLILGDRIICSECQKKLNTCAYCANAVLCSFEQDQSPLPKFVQKNIQRGPAMMQMNIKNPDRISITCKKGCSCWNGEECTREFTNWCEKYREKS